jgi:Protein of unknown function (DUF2934)
MGDTITATTPIVPTDEKVLLERLRDDCDVAFRSWVAQVRVLQSVSSGDAQDQGAIEQARRWANQAAAVYREKRNLFVEFLMACESREGAKRDPDSNSGVDTAVSAKDRSRQVEKIARQIWEESGRPAGTAENDWLQAEKILDTRR